MLEVSILEADKIRRPWLNASGLKVTSIIMAMMCLVFNMSFLVFTWKGKALRVWTSRMYLKAAREGSVDFILGQHPRKA
jgi:hypothetical protein